MRWVDPRAAFAFRGCFYAYAYCALSLIATVLQWFNLPRLIHPMTGLSAGIVCLLVAFSERLRARCLSPRRAHWFDSRFIGFLGTTLVLATLATLSISVE